MIKLSIKIQKHLCIFVLLLLNTILSISFIIYSDKWYFYLFILALGTIINSFSALLLLYIKITKKTDERYIYRKNPKKYIYVMPCYNESYKELSQSINSLADQQRVNDDTYSFVILCDGKVKGKYNDATTDIVLKNILDNKTIPKTFYYVTADKNKNYVEVYKGIYKDVPYLLLVKNTNYGKRDSLTLIRRLCYLYNINHKTSPYILGNFLDYMNEYFDDIYQGKIDYIIGIDADTIFEYRCTYELIKTIEKNNDENIKGCVGFVDVNKSANKFSFYVLYQYSEYLFTQCLRRYAQSNITHKVNCLSGCNQILKICEETCGDLILNKFNYLPDEEENIFNHIRSYASEDRNHVALMLSIYPYVKTIQSLDAICFTNVPMSIPIFMSQRRRWSLGATSNDMLNVIFPGINLFERISSAINIITFSLNPFIIVATVLFVKTIITTPTYLILYISSIMMIPFIYSLLIPIFIKPMIFRDALYYYLSFFIYFFSGSIINMFIYFYSICNMDIIKWGKTRSIVTISDSYNHYQSIDIGEEMKDNKYEEIKDKCDQIDIYIDEEMSDVKLKFSRTNSSSDI